MKTLFSVILWTMLMAGFLVTGMAIGERNGRSICFSSDTITLIPQPDNLWI